MTLRALLPPLVLLAFAFVLGCSKEEPTAPQPAPAPPPPQVAPSVSVVVAPSASASASASAPTPAPAPAPAPAPTPSTPPTPSLTPASSHASSPRWSIDFSTPGCAASTDCPATLRVEALGPYHVNPDYRFRFVPSDTPGLTFTGGTPTDFALQSPKVGLMNVHVRAAAAGPVTLAGTFKICVCTDTECNPEPVSVSLALTVR